MSIYKYTDRFPCEYVRKRNTIGRKSDEMKRCKRSVSLILALLIVTSNLQLPYFQPRAAAAVAAAEHSAVAVPEKFSFEAETKIPDYSIQRQTFADGSQSVVFLFENLQPAQISSDGLTATLDLTNEVREEASISLQLSKAVVEQLLAEQLALQIITGKGDLFLPQLWFADLLSAGAQVLSIEIRSEEFLSKENLVSPGSYNFSITLAGSPAADFTHELTISLPLDRSKITDSRKVSICYFEESSRQWQLIGGKYNAISGQISVPTLHFSKFAAFEQNIGFSDVTSEWAKDEIDVLASRGLIMGVTEQNFQPEATITRAEFTVLLTRTLYREESHSTMAFHDVPADAWYATAVQSAFELGLVSGNGNQQFSPNSAISREQMAILAYQLFQYKKGTPKTNHTAVRFHDQATISDYALEAVDFVSNAGIMQGVNFEFAPLRSSTRQEAAVVLYRLLAYLGEL